MKASDVNSLLTQMKVMTAAARSSPTPAEDVQNAAGQKFGDILLQQIDKVNDLQQTSANLQERFSMGDPEVMIADAKIASLRAKVGIEFLIKTREKIITAYNDIMNMTV